jgi:hypothetical protein
VSEGTADGGAASTVLQEQRRLALYRRGRFLVVALACTTVAAVAFTRYHTPKYVTFDHCDIWVRGSATSAREPSATSHTGVDIAIDRGSQVTWCQLSAESPAEVRVFAASFGVPRNIKRDLLRAPEEYVLEAIPGREHTVTTWAQQAIKSDILRASGTSLCLPGLHTVAYPNAPEFDRSGGCFATADGKAQIGFIQVRGGEKDTLSRLTAIVEQRESPLRIQKIAHDDIHLLVESNIPVAQLLQRVAATAGAGRAIAEWLGPAQYRLHVAAQGQAPIEVRDNLSRVFGEMQVCAVVTRPLVAGETAFRAYLHNTSEPSPAELTRATIELNADLVSANSKACAPASSGAGITSTEHMRVNGHDAVVRLGRARNEDIAAMQRKLMASSPQVRLTVEYLND